jgi:competence protein ComEC
MNTIITSKSKTFFAFCFCFLIGIVISSGFELHIDFKYIYFSFFICTSILMFFWNDRRIRFLFFGVLFLLIGMGRYTLAIPIQDVLEFENSTQTFDAYITAEPDIRIDGVRYIVQTDIGKLTLKYTLYPRFSYGDKLRITCKIKRPEQIEDFRYDMYLARFGVSAICSNPYITKKQGYEGLLFFRKIFELKKRVAEKVNILWPEPHASFMAGLLYGYRGGLGSLNEDFNRTGVTHIVAISGYNITLIASLLMVLFSRLCIPRKKAFYLIIFGIIVFVIFAGLSASVVRAGVMGILVLFARHVGRVSSARNILMATVVLMSLENPYILIWDAGFQLSFLATIGLIYINPIFEKKFQILPELFGIKEAFITTLSATCITLPLIVFQFGRISIVAIVVNILILWIIPYIMGIGFFAVMFGFIYIVFAKYIAFIAYYGMEYIVIIVQYFSSLSFASISFSIPFWAMILLYGLMYIFFKLKH